MKILSLIALISLSVAGTKTVEQRKTFECAAVSQVRVGENRMTTNSVSGFGESVSKARQEALIMCESLGENCVISACESDLAINN